MNKLDHDRLVEIQETMVDLLEEAKTLVRQSGQKHVYERAKAYWIGHIATALSEESDYIGKSMCTMEETINELEVEEMDDEEVEESSDLPPGTDLPN